MLLKRSGALGVMRSSPACACPCCPLPGRSLMSALNMSRCMKVTPSTNWQTGWPRRPRVVLLPRCPEMLPACWFAAIVSRGSGCMVCPPRREALTPRCRMGLSYSARSGLLSSLAVSLRVMPPMLAVMLLARMVVAARMPLHVSCLRHSMCAPWATAVAAAGFLRGGQL